ncbi:hypothetical protein Tco_0344050 [Tanacetum coccineum]
MTAFWVVNNQLQKFIDSKFTLDYDSQMTDTYFVEYTGIGKPSMKEGVNKRTEMRRKSKSIRTDSTVQDDNNRSGNDTDADDADHLDPFMYRRRANGCRVEDLRFKLETLSREIFESTDSQVAAVVRLSGGGLKMVVLAVGGDGGDEGGVEMMASADGGRDGDDNEGGVMVGCGGEAVEGGAARGGQWQRGSSRSGH